MDFKDYSAVMQMGGLLAFAWVVWNELKIQRAERNAHDASYRKELASLRDKLISGGRTKRDTLPED